MMDLDDPWKANVERLAEELAVHMWLSEQERAVMQGHLDEVRQNFLPDMMPAVDIAAAVEPPRLM
jgi:hypothetical protein